MADKDKDTSAEEHVTRQAPSEEGKTDEPQAVKKEAADKDEDRSAHPNSVAEKRGRMIAAGVVLAVILSVIAVLVAGIFQLTSRWLVACPSDLPVNDPAPALWQKMENPKLGNQPLGVAKKLVSETRFKGLSAPAGEAGSKSQPQKAE
ncbi:MAG: hypothetical protein P8182_18260 [Deltaproteobacteria bacterium]